MSLLFHSPGGPKRFAAITQIPKIEARDPAILLLPRCRPPAASTIKSSSTPLKVSPIQPTVLHSSQPAFNIRILPILHFDLSYQNDHFGDDHS